MDVRRTTGGAAVMAAGVSWGEPKAKFRLAAVALVAAVLASLASVPGAGQIAAEDVSVVVRGVGGGAVAVVRAVFEAGGSITDHLSIVDGVAVMAGRQYMPVGHGPIRDVAGASIGA